MNPILHVMFTDAAPFTALTLCLLAYLVGRFHEARRQRRRLRHEEYLREQMYRRHWQHHGLSLHAAPALLLLSMSDLAFAFFTGLAIAVCTLAGWVFWALRPQRHEDDVWSDPPAKPDQDDSIHIP